MKKKKVLFYCKHNSCRSQMAEAYLRDMAGDEFEVVSAGLYPEPIHPMVYTVMEEEGISLDGQTCKGVEYYLGKESFDFVIIVCSEGEAECPKLYPFALNVLRWPFPDPASVTGDEKYVLSYFRATRDSIRRAIADWIREQS